MKKFLSLFSLLILGFALVGCEEDATPMAEKQNMAKEFSETTSEEVMIASYEAYSAERFAELKGSQPFAVFFHAEWCGTCRNWEAMIEEKLVELPASAVILKADFDTEDELKSELKVQMQSTAVFFDADGNEAGRASDPKLNEVSGYFQ